MIKSRFLISSLTCFVVAFFGQNTIFAQKVNTASDSNVLRNIKIVAFSDFTDSLDVIDSLCQHDKVISSRADEKIYKIAHFYIDHKTHTYLDSVCQLDSCYYISGEHKGFFCNRFIIRCNYYNQKYRFYTFSPYEFSFLAKLNEIRSISSE